VLRRSDEPAEAQRPGPNITAGNSRLGSSFRRRAPSRCFAVGAVPKTDKDYGYYMGIATKKQAGAAEIKEHRLQCGNRRACFIDRDKVSTLAPSGISRLPFCGAVFGEKAATLTFRTVARWALI